MCKIRSINKNYNVHTNESTDDATLLSSFIKQKKGNKKRKKKYLNYLGKSIEKTQFFFYKLHQPLISFIN